jgi:hypothetical protein
VTHVYVDPSAAMIEGAGDRALDHEAVRSLRFLTDAGHEVVLVAEAGDSGAPDLVAAVTRTIGELPETVNGSAWYLTRDVEHCRGRSARIRTVLIGTTLPSGSIHRCDTSARDIQAAVMEILAAEAMA